MAKIIAEEQPEFSVLPKDSIVFVRVDSSEVKEVEGQRGTWHKLEFTFTITGIQATGDGSPFDLYDDAINSKIWGSVPFRFTDSPENKLKQWVEAILGLEVSKGFELDTDDLNGRACRAVTSLYAKKTVNPATGKPYMKHQVDSLLAAPSGPGAAPGSWGSATPAQQPANDPWANPSPPANDPWAHPAGFMEEPPF